MKAALLAAAILLTGCATQHAPISARPPDSAIPGTDYGAYPTQYEFTIRTHARGRLLDPDSAQLSIPPPRKAVTYRLSWKGSVVDRQGYAVPVTVRAKNVYGGYAPAQVWWYFWEHGDLRYIWLDGLSQPQVTFTE